MNPIFVVREIFSRALERKKLLIVIAICFVVCAILGAVFVKTPAGYDYHLRLCERYLDRICFSERSVVVIFFERTAGHTLLLALILLGGIHFAALTIPAAALFYRACTFGGSIVIFFSVYRLTGALVVFVLYLPVHLLFDCLFLSATSLSCGRARYFRFCGEDFFCLLRDFLVLSAITAIVCLAEAILLLALFHPLGSIT